MIIYDYYVTVKRKKLELPVGIADSIADIVVDIVPIAVPYHCHFPTNTATSLTPLVVAYLDFVEIKTPISEATLTLRILAIILVVLLVVLLPSLRISVVRSSATGSTCSI